MPKHRPWRWALDQRDPEYEPPAPAADDPEPPDEDDDPTWLGPPDYEGTARYPQ